MPARHFLPQFQTGVQTGDVTIGRRFAFYTVEGLMCFPVKIVICGLVLLLLELCRSIRMAVVRA